VTLDSDGNTKPVMRMLTHVRHVLHKSHWAE